jgi:hypothetical protein
MNFIQEKLLEYHHGYFMAIGLVLFFTGFFLQILKAPSLWDPMLFQHLTVLGALILGYGTGRCDQCSVE